MEPSFSAWSRSRPNLAGVGSGTSDFRSQSRPKKWRLRNMKQLSHLWLMSEANWSFYFLGARRACWPTPGCRCRTAVGWSLAGIPHPACGLAILFCCWPGQNTTPAQSTADTSSVDKDRGFPWRKTFFCPSVAGVLVPRTNAVFDQYAEKALRGQNSELPAERTFCFAKGPLYSSGAEHREAEFSYHQYTNIISYKHFRACFNFLFVCTLFVHSLQS